jgi:hypothetical protein
MARKITKRITFRLSKKRKRVRFVKKRRKRRKVMRKMEFYLSGEKRVELSDIIRLKYNRKSDINLNTNSNLQIVNFISVIKFLWNKV